ncbi:flavin reductase family protein [Streptomyces sp. NPDC052610]|uniref:flavin reductase family protein n=1 Tax=Streptomyces sp. NPDC052610 TaxID=3154952 RepID=UPI00341AB932
MFLPGKTSSAFPVITERGTFCVNVLVADQEWFCCALSVSAGDKFAEVARRPGPQGDPVIDGAVAWTGCTNEAGHDAGDHYIVMPRGSPATGQPSTPEPTPPSSPSGPKRPGGTRGCLVDQAGSGSGVWCRASQGGGGSRCDGGPPCSSGAESLGESGTDDNAARRGARRREPGMIDGTPLGRGAQEARRATDLRTRNEDRDR